jgi:hypothetical protein
VWNIELAVMAAMVLVNGIFVAYEIARLPTIRALFWLVTVRFRPISDSDRDDPVRNYIAEAEHIRPRSRELH